MRTPHKPADTQPRARSTGGMQQFAIKFFYAYRDYHEELAVYSDPLLRPTLPPIFHASTNDDQDAVLSERCAPRSRA